MQMKALLVLFAACVGVVAGAAAGFFIPFYACVIYDNVTNPPPGSGALLVGWLVCLLTIPLGAVTGGLLGGWLAMTRLPMGKSSRYKVSASPQGDPLSFV
jgi:hypothetical protein